MLFAQYLSTLIRAIIAFSTITFLLFCPAKRKIMNILVGKVTKIKYNSSIRKGIISAKKYE